MKYIDGRALEWVEYALVKGLRGVTTVIQKPLLRVDEGGPEDFDFAIAKTTGEGQTANRHNHNWAQIGYVLEGTYNYGPGKDAPAGTVGYFGEGTPYGPQVNPNFTMLVLQFGGICGHGYPGHRRMGEAVGTMAKTGTFSKGVYEFSDNEGKTQRREAGRAVIEHIAGKSVVYPPAQYEDPIWMVPESFKWLDTEVVGVQVKDLGTFSNGAVGIKMFKVDAGATYTQGGDGRRHLVFLQDGMMQNTEAVLGRDSAVYTVESETTEFTAVTNCLGVALTLPSFSTKSLAI